MGAQEVYVDVPRGVDDTITEGVCWRKYPGNVSFVISYNELSLPQWRDEMEDTELELDMVVNMEGGEIMMQVVGHVHGCCFAAGRPSDLVLGP